MGLARLAPLHERAAARKPAAPFHELKFGTRRIATGTNFKKMALLYISDIPQNLARPRGSPKAPPPSQSKHGDGPDLPLVTSEMDAERAPETRGVAPRRVSVTKRREAPFGVRRGRGAPRVRHDEAQGARLSLIHI